MASLAELTDREPQPALSEFNNSVGSRIDDILNKLTGANGQQRYQLWPEKVIRGGLTAAGDALAGNVPQWAVDKDTGEVHTSPQMIEKAQEISALAGTGGLAGASGTVLGAGPIIKTAKNGYELLKNPTASQMEGLIKKDGIQAVRMMVNPETKDVYAFNNMNYTHNMVAKELAHEGIDLPLKNNDYHVVPQKDGSYAISDANNNFSKLIDENPNVARLIKSKDYKIINEDEFEAALHPDNTLYSDNKVGTGIEAIKKGAFLRPALKYKDKIYKGKEGQQHQDVIPKELYPEFEQMAMNGEDISHYNFGFMNHKGQFLDREKALEYAINEGIVDAHAGQYGALTSTLMADSSKPGTAIEAMGKALEKQRSLEGYRAAIKDPETGKIYDNGRWHPEIIHNIEDQAIRNRIIDAFVNKSDKNKGYFTVAGYMNKSNKFFNRNEMEKGIKDSTDLPINKSKTAQFRSTSLPVEDLEQ